jgi:hypothetical protein
MDSWRVAATQVEAKRYAQRAKNYLLCGLRWLNPNLFIRQAEVSIMHEALAKLQYPSPRHQ